MIIRTRAPLRIGLAGGGTDIETYSKQYGGAVFNATIGMYAYCTLIPTNNNKIKIIAYDNQNNCEVDSIPKFDILDNTLILHKGAYNRIVKDFNGGKPLSFTMSTSNDAPIGSGLGTSSTMIVAILEAYNRWLKLGLNAYELSELAFDIERNDLKLIGGKQDQFAAVFGGFNYMEFKQDGTTIVNPLRLEKHVINELECSLLLYYNGISRQSSDVQLVLANNIINQQMQDAQNKQSQTINAMNHLKEIAYDMKNNLLTGDIDAFAECLRKGWDEKKKTSEIVSNKNLESIISYVMANGAEAVKISGAGGNGFLMIYCNPVNRQKLVNELVKLPGKIFPIKFTKDGVESWIIQ